MLPQNFWEQNYHVISVIFFLISQSHLILFVVRFVVRDRITEITEILDNSGFGSKTFDIQYLIVVILFKLFYVASLGHDITSSKFLFFATSPKIVLKIATDNIKIQKKKEKKISAVVPSFST
jgi:hypothetical protein